MFHSNASFNYIITGNALLKKIMHSKWSIRTHMFTCKIKGLTFYYVIHSISDFIFVKCIKVSNDIYDNIEN